MTAMCGRTTRSASSNAWSASTAASAGGGVCTPTAVEMSSRCSKPSRLQRSPTPMCSPDDDPVAGVETILPSLARWSREPNRKGVSTMKMKSYKATFFRHNPQFKNGGYVTERKIEAVSLPSARKRAREISEHCVYGSMELLDIEMEA